jgi:hypothetical protein
MSNDQYPAYQRQLQPLIAQTYDNGELRTLCFALGLHYDNLEGQTLDERTVSLVQKMGRQSRLGELYAVLCQQRPHATWPPPPFAPTPPPVPDPTSTPPPPLIANPFGQRGRLERPDIYLPRQPFTDNLWQELQKGTSLSLVGASQTGKSSMLWQLIHEGPSRLHRPAEDFVYLDMQTLHNDDDFFACLCEALGLPTVVQGYGLARALRGRHILLALDEIEQMTWQGFTYTVRSQLRGLADGASTPLTLVIASRSPLGELFPDTPTESSPLAGLCLTYRLPLFTEAEAQALVGRYLAGTGWGLPEALVAGAWAECGGHPGELQKLLHALFAQHRRLGG